MNEENKRFKTFVENKLKIKNHNSDLSQEYKLGVNQFMDITSEEFKKIYLKPIKFKPSLN